MKNKFIPFYFPQLHRIPENDKWWGEGYTDWDRVKSAMPHHHMHYQPRIPLHDKYYDQSEENTLRWQINLAQEYNVFGFNFYHYWFDGKLLLEKPLQIFKRLDHDLKFCITWANETWSKRWDGKFNEILIQQNHNYDIVEWEKHFDYLLEYFKDERYIKIDGKPVFMIYRPDIFPKVNEFLMFMRQRATNSGLKGLHIVGIKAYEVKYQEIYDPFDAILIFQPRDFFGHCSNDRSKTLKWLEKKLRNLPEKYQLWLGDVRHKFQNSTAYSIDDFWEHILKIAKGNVEPDSKKIWTSILPDWDNTARYGKKSKYFLGSSPHKFEEYLKQLIEIESRKQEEDRLFFVNAWNEWSEGAYLEPDEKNGYEYLNVIKRLSDV